MARIILVLAAIGTLAIAPPEAAANTGLPWFAPHEISPSFLPAVQTSDQPKATTDPKNQKPRKRMLAMSISHGKTSRRAPGTAPLPSSSSIAVLVSLLGLVGIGMLTRTVPVKESEKVR